MKRYCLALDLKDDDALIAEYEEHHQKVWPEILKSLKDSGIQQMEIYRINTGSLWSWKQLMILLWNKR